LRDRPDRGLISVLVRRLSSLFEDVNADTVSTNVGNYLDSLSFD
jgi:hypothetical protein